MYTCANAELSRDTNSNTAACVYNGERRRDWLLLAVILLYWGSASSAGEFGDRSVLSARRFVCVCGQIVVVTRE